MYAHTTALQISMMTAYSKHSIDRNASQCTAKMDGGNELSVFIEYYKGSIGEVALGMDPTPAMSGVLLCIFGGSLQRARDVRD